MLELSSTPSDGTSSTVSAFTHRTHPQDPFAERTEYHDGLVDRLFIKIFCIKLAEQLKGKDAAPHTVKCLQSPPHHLTHINHPYHHQCYPAATLTL